MRNSYDVLIITALLDELKALESVQHRLVDAWRSSTASDGSPYSHCTIQADDGTSLHVAAAWTGAMGEAMTAIKTTALVGHFSPACIAMCGICAGYRGKVSLGDVIVADRVYSYDHGKLVKLTDAQGKQEERFYHDFETYAPPKDWRVAAEYFSRDLYWSKDLCQTRPISHAHQQTWLLDALLAHEQGRGVAPVDHPDRRTLCPSWSAIIASSKSAKLVDTAEGTLCLAPEGRTRAKEHQLHYPDGLPPAPPFKVHIGPIATGKTVREDAELFPRLEMHIRKTLGVEMEAAAIGLVAQQFDRPAIVVKAVSDHADRDKDDSFRTFAATASAEFLIRFLCRQGGRILGRTSETGLIVTSSPPPPHVAFAPSANPFHTAGTLPAGHPTYVKRASDIAFDRAIVDKRILSVEAPSGIGKSSLLLRAQADLAARATVCYVDLSGLRIDTHAAFYKGLFKKLSKSIGKSVEDWSDIEEHAEQRPIILMLDEFGYPTAEILQKLVPSLYHMATISGTHVRIVVGQPLAIRTLLKNSGSEDAKFLDACHSVALGPLNDDETAKLLSLLSPRAERIAMAHRATITRFSQGHPRSIQRLCHRMFDAEAEGKNDDFLRALVHDGALYA